MNKIEHSSSTAQPESTEIPAQKPTPNDVEPLLIYLNGPTGHEIVSRVLAVIESIKHSTLDKSTTNARVEKYIQATVLLAVIVATSVLVGLGKFEASVGVLFGTLVGFAFGKK